MGKLDRYYDVSFEDDQAASSVELIGGKHFRLDQACFGDHLLAALSPRMIDLLRIATSIYVIDSIAGRDRRSEWLGWSRTLRVKIEVFDHDFWGQDQVRSLLAECLDFLGGDFWELDFTAGRADESPPNTGLLPFGDAPPLICLYSGGLDSAAGLSKRVRDMAHAQVIPVLVRHQSAQRQVVDPQLEVIKRRYGTNLSVLVPGVIKTLPASMLDAENTHRCRGFLFSSVGGVVAWALGATEVEMFESGIGAINLPLMSGMVGSKATRSSHPEFLRLISRLLSLAAGRGIALTLPFLNHTKGEVVRTLATDGLHEMARQTVSCVHSPLRNRGPKQCGFCPACIFRRQAMFTAGIAEADDAYLLDLFGNAERVNQIEPRRLKYLKALLMQVDKLGELDSDGPVPLFFKRHIVGSGIVSPGESLAPHVELYQRYRREWLDLVAAGQAEGRSWADLLAPATFPASI